MTRQSWTRARVNHATDTATGGAAAAGGAADADDGVRDLRLKLGADLTALCELTREAAAAAQCWRHAFPEAAVAAVAAAVRAALQTICALHDACAALRPGGAVQLLEPLMKPLARVELDIAACLQVRV